MKGEHQITVLKGVLECLKGGIKPDVYLNSILDFQPPEGITHILFDLEGTLTGYGKAEPAPGIKEKLESLACQGYKCQILSNKPPKMRKGKDEFLAKVRDNFGIPIIDNECYKPSVNAYKEAMEFNGCTDPKNMAMVGDKLALDILGARKAGLGYAALVRPIPSHLEPAYLWFYRPIEWLYLRRLKITGQNI